MSLNLYNTLTREVSSFTPIVKGKVGIYLCGATVQAPPHIGHIRSGINFDILRRWLIASGYEVTFIRNVTDIDDKILHNAINEQIPWWALAQKYERVFASAYAELNVMPPTYEPRATGHITQMVELISLLIKRGKAYALSNGDVYLDVRSLESYLTLSGQKLDDLQSTADGEESLKKNPQDFALWKSAKPGEPSKPQAQAAGQAATNAATKLAQAAAQIREQIGRSAEKLSAEATQQLGKVTPVRESVDQAVAQSESSVTEKMQNLAAADPAVVAAHAEALGFASYWVPDHIILPVRYSTPYPGNLDGGPDPDYLWQMPDPMIAIFILHPICPRQNNFR